MSLVQQDVMKIPKMVNFVNLDGERVIQLPTNAMITVRSNRGNVYQAPITNKTFYNANDLLDKEARFTAQIDTEKWTIHRITKVHPLKMDKQSVEQERREYMELGGNY
jgi:hypothetical protein